MEDARVWLRVPFVEKGQAARLGAVWCPDRGRWFIPATLERACFDRWIGHDQAAPADWSLSESPVADEGEPVWPAERRRVGQRDGPWS